MLTSDAARFLDKNTHLFREVTDTGATTYCGLHERNEIWIELTPQEADTVTCRFCVRRLAERLGDIEQRLDSIQIGPGGALYG